MKFLVDNQLPIALSRWLQNQGMVSYHVLEIYLDEATDK
jgi:predicted nuclease of predicted toxin-antitoxin system